MEQKIEIIGEQSAPSFKVSVTKSTEEDVFNDGCIPKTWNDLGEIYTFRSSSLELVKHRVETFLCHDLESAEVFEGRLEIQRLEDENGEEANKHQKEAWKEGRLNLYAATYSIYLERVQTETVNAEILKEI